MGRFGGVILRQAQDEVEIQALMLNLSKHEGKHPHDGRPPPLDKLGMRGSEEALNDPRRGRLARQNECLGG